MDHTVAQQGSQPISVMLTAGLQRSLAAESSGKLSLLALEYIVRIGALYWGMLSRAAPFAPLTGLAGIDVEINRLRKGSDVS